MKFGQLLRQYRTQYGYSKLDLAKRMNVSLGYIVNVESGKKKPLTQKRCEQIKLILGLNNKEYKTFISQAIKERMGDKNFSFLKETTFLNNTDTNNILNNNILSIPVLGVVSAEKVDTFEQSEYIDHIYIDRRLIKVAGKITSVKAEGDCLADEHIFDGDYAIIQEDNTLKLGPRPPSLNGKIPVYYLKINDEYTLKRAYIEGKYVVLESANANAPRRWVIDPKKDAVKIVGKVVGHYGSH